jgi:hypothetical protein
MRGNFLREMSIAKCRPAIIGRAMQAMQSDRPKSPVQALFWYDVDSISGNSYPKKPDQNSAIYTDTF